MPTPSNPAPRRASSSAASPSRPVRTAKRSAPDAPKPDAGTRRRALKKKRSRQGNWIALTALAAITVVIGGFAFGLKAAGFKTKGIWTELGTVRGRVAQKRATLADLRVQFESGQRRLHALSSAGGKERVLVENGFIKPGERLLLFPKDAPKK